MLADMSGSGKPPRLAYERWAVVSAFTLDAQSSSGMTREHLVVAPSPLSPGELPDLMSSAWLRAEWPLVICARTRGGGEFDGRQGVRRRCPPLHPYLM
jgi:hypothetical protein